MVLLARCLQRTCRLGGASVFWSPVLSSLHATSGETSRYLFYFHSHASWSASGSIRGYLVLRRVVAFAAARYAGCLSHRALLPLYHQARPAFSCAHLSSSMATPSCRTALFHLNHAGISRPANTIRGSATARAGRITPGRNLAS